ncbi:hypothetical protein CCACVL1_24742 [Corchorus capsularis]|uniref:DUF4220 domain-containing protein n=1 Tax=Corchorus capsularis TaxID=210143 RepID=A0A1R3GN99_COCAP|nr:hypothetical protein CCACVL1_24742 [Corchorus capsularis]
MVDPIPPEVKRVWDKWNIRGTILFSLSLQTFLVLLAPFRKSTRKRLLIMLIWSAYLLADAAANFTVGLISNSQGNNNSNPSPDQGKHKDNGDLLAFWAPFLLLHLGGPDTITAFALEDNELWLRHLLGLGFQAFAALYVFIQSIKNIVLIPTILMFVAGTIKYAERTRALYLASLDRFRDSLLGDAVPGPNYAKLMDEYAFKRENKLPTQMIMISEPDKEARATDMPVKKGQLNDLEVVHYASKYFQIFKGLIVDNIFSFHERNESREFFRERKAEDALRVIEVELNFIYEVLYTKVQVVHSGWGYAFRGIAFGSILASLGVFYFKIDKNSLNPFDVGITYTLLLGAVVLDVIALFMLIFSDWSYATVKDPDSSQTIAAKISKRFLKYKSPWWQIHKCEIRDPNNPNQVVKTVEHHVLATPILFRRWSGSLSSYNLISYCLKIKPSTMHEFWRWPSVIAEKVHINGCFQFVSGLLKKALKAVSFLLSGVIYIFSFIKNKLIGVPIKFIVKMLKLIPGLNYIIERITVAWIYVRTYISGILSSGAISDFADEIIYVSREPFTKELWDFIFKELQTKAEFADDPEAAERISEARGEWVLTDGDSKIDRSSLLQYVTEVQYDESILLWHIATDLCYHTNGEDDQVLDEDSFNYREFSKLLSDYMLYLLIMQPTMMSAVAGIGKIRFRDTCAEAERFFDRPDFHPLKKKNEETGKTKIEESSIESEACAAILKVNTDVKPVAVKGDGSKSVLFDASTLAKELNILEKKGVNKWKLMSRVWVELISYAAGHCRANTHAQQVTRGGELITFIWLLMAHFGLGEQFQINAGHARAKLIVGK